MMNASKSQGARPPGYVSPMQRPDRQRPLQEWQTPTDVWAAQHPQSGNHQDHHRGAGLNYWQNGIAGQSRPILLANALLNKIRPQM
jgi:hypothetical protein